MKKAIFTLFQHQRWLPMRRLALMFLFVWSFLGIQCLKAQIVVPFSSSGDTCNTTTLTTCNGSPTTGSTSFKDDGINDGLYADNRARKDTIEICPKDQQHRVEIIFKEFGLESGDSLFAFNGNKAVLRSGSGAGIGAGSGAGVGVSKAFGGWINASCDPKVNPSGCLTFIFKTDGDNSKGKGWDAWVDCVSRDIKLGPVLIPSRILTVDSAAYGHITIPAPVVVACGDTLPTMSDSVRLIVKNQLGDGIYRYRIDPSRNT